MLILGASSDLAAALILKVAANYQTIFAHYYSNKEVLEQLQQMVPCELQLIQADFTDEQATANLVDEVDASGQSITHIVHCPSSKAENVRFKDLSWKTYEHMLNTQLRSLYYVLHRMLPDMAKRKYGKIVSILTSYTTGTPPAFGSPYVTAKYAQLGFLKALSVEYARKNVQINAVSPSMVETKFLDDLPELIVQKSAQEHPLGRNARVEDIVPAIEFLLSDGSGFMTGQNLLISGGESI
ncbi:MAG: SDR family oxidoreductase [Clostridiales bacterium]|nr:SDR family oxidoreductase [Clostridiales bacterium]